MCFWSFSDTENDQIQSERAEVKVRYVGHQILLQLGDSTSRVLPIEQEDGTYRIRFEHPIAILPDDLVSVIDRSVAYTKLPPHYLVMVEECSNSKVVYSFERDTKNVTEVIACGQRQLEKGCYIVALRFVNVQQKSNNWVLYIIGLLALGGGTIFYLFKFVFNSNSSQVRLGRYRFDTKAMYLVYEGERVDMTTRESDLLFLLFQSINSTVKKEQILNEIWGDEGSYDGRTLDVFISRLRKKLAYDQRIKLVNVKGVGYKLIIES